jgi:hypothetical protein
MPTTGTALRLHVDSTSRTVWSQDGADCNRLSDAPGELPYDVVNGVEEVRLLGLRANAQLICHLHTFKSLAGWPRSIRLATPLICTREEREQPEKVFEKMAAYQNCAPSLGGWHEVTARDIAAYMLICALDGDPVLPGGRGYSVLTLLQRHPVWPAVSFVPTAEQESVAELLGLIIDPRWYVSSRHPDRSAKLRAYLGLIESNFRQIYDRNGSGPHLDRARCVLRAWCGSHSPVTVGGVPGDFLRRCVYRHGNSYARGLLRASSLFVSLIRNYWLQALDTSWVNESRSVARELFVPEYFFEGDDPGYQGVTSAAFRRHVAAFAG